MDIILFILGLVLCLIGITGSFVPMIPGPLVSWLAILILNLTDAVEFNLNFVLITLSVAVSVGLIDYLIPIIGVKKLGGSKSGQVGAIIGLVLGAWIMPPFGILVGPFVGAISGEMVNKKTFSESLKPAFGSLVGVVAGSIIKFCLTLSYLFLYLKIFWTYKSSFI